VLNVRGTLMESVKPAPDEAGEGAPEIIAKKHHSLLFRYIIRKQVARCFADPSWNRDLFDRFVAGQSGGLPDPGAGGVILAACNDLYYWKFAPTLLLSIERQEYPECVHLHLYKPDTATLDHISRLGEKLRFVRLSWTVDACGLAQGMHYPSIYFTSARFLCAAMLVEHLSAPILCIDVDGIARRPVWPAYRQIANGGDFGLILRPRAHKPWRKVLASATGFNATEPGLRFISSVARSLCVLFQRRPLYHLDQTVLHYASEQDRRHADPGRLFVIPHTMSDYEFGEDAVIWTAKGWKTKNSELYKAAKGDVEAAFPESAGIFARP